MARFAGPPPPRPSRDTFDAFTLNSDTIDGGIDEGRQGMREEIREVRGEGRGEVRDSPQEMRGEMREEMIRLFLLFTFRYELLCTP